MSPDTAQRVPDPYDYNRLSMDDRPHRECFFCGRRATQEIYAGRASTTRLYLCERHRGNLLEILSLSETKIDEVKE